MKKKMVILGLCLVLATGCGRVPKLKNGEEAAVTFEKGKDISVDSLYNEMKDTYALETLLSMIDKQILEDKFKGDIKDATTSAESTIKSLEESYKDDLLKMIQTYTGMQSIEAYQNSLYINYLKNKATEDYAKKQVSDDEINKYYDEKVIGDIEVSHILITADVKDSMSEDEKKSKEDEALTKANNLIAELKKADDIKAKFTELAKANSKDESTAPNGGSLGYINYGTLSSDYDAIIDAAQKLKNNSYSTEAIKTSLGYHIILRTNQKDKAKKADVKDTIIEKLSEDIISNDSTINVKAMQELRKKYGMNIQDSKLKEQYANYIQNSLSANNNQ